MATGRAGVRVAEAVNTAEFEVIVDLAMTCDCKDDDAIGDAMTEAPAPENVVCLRSSMFAPGAGAASACAWVAEAERRKLPLEVDIVGCCSATEVRAQFAR